ncbi:hypothetical protein KKI24_07930 [bacterium]|nr:hypothetical protein [bacterium]
MTHTASSTIDVLTGKTLTYSNGAAVDIGAFTLDLPGAGTIANTGAITLNHGSAVLKIVGAATISGPVALALGMLDVNEDTTISGALTHTASSTIDVLTGKTLSYSGGAFNVGAFTLTLSGAGTISNAGNAITMNDNVATLTMTGSGGTTSAVTVSAAQTTGRFNVNADYAITTLTTTANAYLQSSGSNTLTVGTLNTGGGDNLTLDSKISVAAGTINGNIILNGGTFASTASLTVAGAITHTASSSLDVATSTTLTYTGAAVNIGAFTLTMPGAGTLANTNALTLPTGSTLLITGAATISGPVILNDGILDVNESSTISGALTHTAASTIDIQTGKTLTYTGAAIAIGAFTLDMPGAGILANTNALSIDTNSTLQITGSSSVISGPVILNDGILDIDASTTISGAMTHTASSTINVAAGITLTYTGAPVSIGAFTLDLQGGGTGTIANTNAFSLGAGSTLQVAGAYTISGPVALAGGTLDIDAATTISGAITHTANSVVNVASGVTLSYTGAAVTMGAFSISLQGGGTGTIANTNVITVSSGATLQTTGGAYTISGPVALAGGTLDIDVATTISGAITHTTSSVVNVASGITLTYTGAAVNIGAFTLSLQGGGVGTIANTNAFTVGTGATLQTTGAYTISGPIILNDGTLDIDAATTVSGAITHTASSTIDVNTGITLTYTGAAISVGAFTLDLPGAGTFANTNAVNLNVGSSELQIDGAGTVSGPVILNGGLLDVNETSTISGAITHTASSTIDVLSGKTLTYSGAAVAVGAFTMTLPGAGNVSNVGSALTINNAISTITISGSGGTIAAVTGSTAQTSGRINVNANHTITTLTVNTDVKVQSSGSNTLTVGTLNSTGGSNLTLYSKILVAAGTVNGNIILAGGTFGSSANLTVAGTITHIASSSLDVATGTTLTYANAASIDLGAYILTLPGQGTIANTGAINLNNGSSVLQVDGSGAIISGPVILAGGTLLLNQSATVSGAMTHTASSIINVAGTRTLTYSGAAINIGAFTLDLDGDGTIANTNAINLNSGSAVLKIDGAATISGPVILALGTLDVNDNTSISGAMTHTASSTIDVASGKTLTYSGGALNVGAFALTIPGAGIISNTGNAITLNDNAATLTITGSGGTTSAVTVSIAQTTGRINVNANYTVTTLTTTANAYVQSSGSNTLTVSNLNTSGGNNLTLDSKILVAGGTVNGNIILNGGTFASSASLTVAGNITHTASSTLDVATSTTLTYSGLAVDIGAFTLTMPGAGTLANTNALNLNNASAILKVDGAATISGPVILALGTLDVNENTTISGAVTHTANSTVDVLTGKTLTYSNAAAINVGAFTLTVPGAGTIANTGTINLNNGAAILQINGAATISGPIALALGTLDVNENTTVSGAITHTASSSIDILTGKTLTYSGAAVAIGAFTLTMPGAGTLANTNAISIDTGSTLNITGASTISGPVTLNDGTLDLDANTTISGALTHTASSTINIANGITLTYTGAAVSIGAFTLDLQGAGTATIASTNAFSLGAGSTLQVAAAYTISGPIALAGGTLDINVATTVSGNITHTASSVIDVAAGITLSYTGAAVDVGAFTLSLQGGGVGTIANTNAFTLGTGATLQTTGAYTISGPIALAGGTLDINAATTVSGNMTHTASSVIDVASGITLTYSGAAVDVGAFTLALQGGGVGTIANTNAITLGTGATLQTAGAYTIAGPIILNDGTLDINAATTVSGTITHTASSSIDVNTGITLTYTGAAISIGAFTLDLPGAGTIANTNTISLGTGSTLLTTGTATISGPVVLNDGTLDINENTTISGAVTHTAASTVDVLTGKTLTYSNAAAIDLGAFTLDLPGAGTIANTGAINLNHASAVLKIDGAATVSGPVILALGKLDINENSTISGAVTHTASSTLDIASGKILTYSNAVAVSLGAFTLTMSGTGSLANTGAINLDNASSELQIDGSGTTITGPVTLANGILDVNQDATISGLVTMTANVEMAIASSKTLTYSNSTAISIGGGLTLMFSEAGSFAGDIQLNGGTLDVNESMTLTSACTLTHTLASTIDIATGKTLTYQGTALNVGALDLTMTTAASSSFATNSPVTLNNADSRLVMTGSGTLSKVTVSAASNAARGIVVNGGTYIITDLTASASLRINVASGTLTIGNNFTVNAASTLTVTGAGTLTFHDIILSASLDIDGTILLADDATLIVLANATFGPGGNLTFKDGLNVADGVAFIIEDADGTYTLTFQGGITIAGTGTVTLQGDESLVLEYPSPDSTTLAKFTDASTGTMTPTYVQPITGFQVASVGDQQINLSWTNPGGASVLIRRSTTGYPTSILSGTQVSDATGTSYSDTGLTNNVTYYYTAFTHTTANNHTSGSNADGTPVASIPTYNNDVTSFTAAVGDGQVSLSWGAATGWAGVKIMRKTTGYPASESDGTEVYNGSGTSTIDRGLTNGSGYKGLTNGTVYYYRAFAYDSGTNYAPGVNAIAAAASLSTGLAAYYPISGNASDGSGQGYHGEVYNATATTDRKGTADQAYLFNSGDGDNDYIEIDNAVTENFTIAFWFSSTQSAGAATNWYDGRGLVDAKTGSGQNDFGVALGAGKVMFGTGNPDTTIVSPSSYNNGEWYHVTAVRTKATGSLKLYIQASQVASGTGSTNTLNAPTQMRIAGSPQYNTVFFDGKMDDVRIYNRVLNLTEIQKLYFSGAAISESRISSSDTDTSSHTCLLVNVATGSNNIRCWGDARATGILGDGSSTNATSTPVQVNGITTAVQVSAGLNHNCAVLSDKTISCWGEGANGKLGNGSTSNQSTPVAVSSIIDAAQVSAGGEHSCAVLDNGFSGTVKCWGSATSGQLGNGSSTGTYSTPQLVTGISSAVQVDTGNDFSCALLSDRTVQCWGNGDNGKLGNGAILTQNTPVPVSLVSGAVQLSVGYNHACALIYDGTIKCWGKGDGTDARMGDGFSNATNSTPTTVSGISNAVQVSSGKAHTCALLSDATMKCWGYNSNGQLGDGGTTTQDSPVVVSGVSSVTSVSVGGNTSCAVYNDGTAKCWGEGSTGELGNGTTSDNSTPQSVSGLSNSAKQ